MSTAPDDAVSRPLTSHTLTNPRLTFAPSRSTLVRNSPISKEFTTPPALQTSSILALTAVSNACKLASSASKSPSSAAIASSVPGSMNMTEVSYTPPAELVTPMMGVRSPVLEAPATAPDEPEWATEPAAAKTPAAAAVDTDDGAAIVTL